MSGGSEEAILAVKGLHCSICRKSAETKLPRPGRVRDNLGQFNEVVLGNFVHLKDADGEGHDFMVIIDDGTSYAIVRRLDRHTQENLIEAVGEGWINWAGPPDLLVADGEKGFASEAFAAAMGRAGVMYVPPAAYSPWQKGKVERMNQTVRTVVKKCVLHMGPAGRERYEGGRCRSGIRHQWATRAFGSERGHAAFRPEAQAPWGHPRGRRTRRTSS